LKLPKKLLAEIEISVNEEGKSGAEKTPKIRKAAQYQKMPK